MNDQSSGELRVLAIFAHPDDPEFSCAGSAAAWVEQGAHITYVIVTNGAAGSNDRDQDIGELVYIRQAEQRAACAVLGVQEVHFLGYADGTLQASLELRRDLTRIIRQVKPQRVVVGDPTVYFRGDRYINHPDHRAAGEAALYAVFPSAVTRPIFPELLAEGHEPHQVNEIYMTSDRAAINTFVDISGTIEKKIEALRCHKSQFDVGDGEWIRKWAVETGGIVGFDYAEAFRVMKLVDEESQ
ncbi:MAG: PIG-L deacetylase family protein [Chloroflexota bacterium]|nr:PIG-L deacetylase family protein [Chloroflexota bacterium]